MKGNRLSWEYIAGFFDGEGTVRMADRGGIQVSMAQAFDRGLCLLSEIRDFLVEHGIASKVYKYQGKRSNMMYGLYTCGRKNVTEFLTSAFPYLRIKKLEAQDMLRYMRLYPPMSEGPALGMLIRERAKTRSQLNLRRGSAHPNSTLTEAQVMVIKKRLAASEPVYLLAKEFGISWSGMDAIKKGLAWKHITAN